MESFSATGGIVAATASVDRPRRLARERRRAAEPVSIKETAPARRSDGGIDVDCYLVRAQQLRARTQAAWLLSLCVHP
jgi:hypothetical protein